MQVSKAPLMHGRLNEEPAFRETRIVRSARRRKTVAARVEDGVLVVSVPARMSTAEAEAWVERMAARFKRAPRPDPLADQGDLERRAARLNRAHFEGKLTWASIVYVTNQTSKYGSCSPGSRRIRISHRVAAMPTFVLEYIIVHELAHLIEANHGRRFWRLVHRYPYAERAIGYLMAHGLVSAQERVEEPSLFIPPSEDLQTFAAAAHSSTNAPRAHRAGESAASEAADDGFDDDAYDPFDDPALYGGMQA